MKGMSSTILALIFAVFSLYSLMTADRSPEKPLSALRHNQARVSGVGLQFALQRYLERASLRRSRTQDDKSRPALGGLAAGKFNAHIATLQLALSGEPARAGATMLPSTVTVFSIPVLRLDGVENSVQRSLEAWHKLKLTNHAQAQPRAGYVGRR